MPPLPWLSLLGRHRLKLLFGVMAIGGLVVALLPSSNMPLFPHADKLQHALAFMLYALVLDKASPHSFWLWKAPLLLGYGLLIEAAQAFTPWRSVSLGDVVADALGIALYWVLIKRL